MPTLSQLGNGSYHYIPDGTMVGTVFINWIANSATSICSNSILYCGSQRRVLGRIRMDMTRYCLFNDIPEGSSDLRLEIQTSN